MKILRYSFSTLHSFIQQLSRSYSISDIVLCVVRDTKMPLKAELKTWSGNDFHEASSIKKYAFIDAQFNSGSKPLGTLKKIESSTSLFKP